MLRFSLILLLLLLNHPADVQDTYIAVITNPEIGAEGSAQNLLEAVDSINQNPDIDYVVVLGNITAGGKFDEFLWAQEILDGLYASYFVLGGKNDYLLSEGRGSEISLLWGDDKKIILNNNLTLVGLNTIVPEFSNKNYINIETLKWFNEEISNSSSSRILTFSYKPLHNVANKNHFFQNITDKKIFGIVSTKDKSLKHKNLWEGFYLNRVDGWGYSLVRIRSGEILIHKVLKVNSRKPEVFKTSFSDAEYAATFQNGSKLKNQQNLWTVKYNKSTVTSAVYSRGKLFSGFKDGSVICIDETGKEKWRYETNGRIYSSPVLEKDLLVVSTNEGDLLTLNANTGSLVRVIGIGETITSEIGLIDVEKGGASIKAVTAGTGNGNLYCYDLYALEPIWINRSANISESNGIFASITSSDKKIFFQDKEGTIYCVSAVNGLLLWIWKPDYKSKAHPLRSDISVSGYNIFVADAGGSLYCIDALLGTEKWKIKNIRASGIIGTNENNLIIPTRLNEILTISAKSGKILDKINVNLGTNDESITDLLIVGKSIFAGFTDGSVFEIKKDQNPKLLYKSFSKPIVSLVNLNGNLFIKDYDGTFVLLNLEDHK